MTGDRKPFEENATEETTGAVFKFGGKEPVSEESKEVQEAQAEEVSPAMTSLPGPEPSRMSKCAAVRRLSFGR